jgi:hypothetical protein
MIDTVVLRVHNTTKYKKLIETIKQSGEKIGLSQNQIFKDNIDFGGNFLEIVETQFSDSNKFNIRMRDKVYLPSSHYLLSWSADYRKEYIEFNFSIPKLVYGTNVIQFVRHQIENQGNTIFDLFRQSKMTTNMNDTYERLIFFLERFLILHCQWSELDIYGETHLYSVDHEDLEIQRIDLCFNQIFDSEKEALQYLELQKDIRKKYEKDNSKSSRGWKTSIWMRTDRYVAKIYHKGSEYATNDLKHHLKLNTIARKQIFDVKALQDLADRTLRYEISFKNSYLSYLFKNKLFRKKDKFHLKLKANFDLVNSLDSKINRRRKKAIQIAATIKKHPNHPDIENLKNEIELINQEKKKLEKKMNDYYELDFLSFTSENCRVIQRRSKLSTIYSNMISLNTKFFMKVSKREEFQNKHTDNFNVRDTSPQIIQKAKFSKELLTECMKVFKDFFKQFQIKERKDFNVLEEMIKQYNKKAESNNTFFKNEIDRLMHKKIQLLNTSSLVRIWEYTRNNSWEQLEKKGILKRSSVYRYKKIFENLGIQKNEFSAIPLNPSMNFAEYHNILFNSCQIKLNNIYFY